MGQYYDVQEAAVEVLERRLLHRRRLVQAVRGILRTRYGARKVAAGNLFLSTLAGLPLSLLAWQAGLSPWGGVPGLEVAIMWPEYVWLTGRAAERLAPQERFERDVEAGIASDENADIAADAGFLARTRRRLSTPEMRRSMEIHTDGDIGSPPVLLKTIAALIILGLVTAGLTLLWQIIASGPTLLAETIVDGPLSRRDPQFWRRVEVSATWWRQAFGTTAPYFFSLAIVVVALGWFLELLRPLWP